MEIYLYFNMGRRIFPHVDGSRASGFHPKKPLARTFVYRHHYATSIEQRP